MEYEITQVSGIAHGHGLAILYPAWMRYVYKNDVNRFAMFANKVFDIDYIKDLDFMALQGIEALETFYHSLGVSTRLSENGIDESMILDMANKVTKDGTISIGSFMKLTIKDVIEIYKSAL